MQLPLQTLSASD